LKSRPQPGHSPAINRKRSFLALWLALLLTSVWQQAAAQTRPETGAAAATAAAPAQGTTPTSNQESFFVSRQLPNGLTMVVYEDHVVPLVTVEFAVRAGSFIEKPEQSGLSHLYEHMFFKSNRATRNGDAYLKNIDQLGIAYNGTTREENCTQYFTSVSANLGTALLYLRDAAEYPVFDPLEVAQEKQVVLGEIDRNTSNPFFALNKEMNERLFFSAPNRKDPLGSRETVSNATPEMLKAFQSQYWVPNNAAIIVSGDVNPEDAFQQITKLFGDWGHAADPFQKSPPVHQLPMKESSGAVLQAPVQNVVIELGWQGPSIGQDTAASYAADVFSYILRQPESRFQKTIVDSGLATAVDLGYYTQSNTGPINLILQTTPDKARAALKAAENEIAHFNDPTYFTDQELQNAKTLLAASDLFERERPSEYVHNISFWWASTSLDYLKGYQQMLGRMSRADIQRYVTTYIQGKPRVTLVMLSPEAQQLVKLKNEELNSQ